MFVDTRLHIAVRPALEYQLPEAGLLVKACLLGDGRREDAVAALQSLLRDYVEPDDGGPDDGGPDDGGPDGLRPACAHVCTHAHEYLQGVAAAWRTELAHVRDGVRRATRDVQAQHVQALEVRARLRSKSPRIVDEEYRRETARLRTLLDDHIATLRARPVPTCERPESLVRATHTLKDHFANSYGTMPTPCLMRIKAHFERELARLQQQTAKAFVRHAAALLKPSAPASS